MDRVAGPESSVSRLPVTELRLVFLGLAELIVVGVVASCDMNAPSREAVCGSEPNRSTR